MYNGICIITLKTKCSDNRTKMNKWDYIIWGISEQWVKII